MRRPLKLFALFCLLVALFPSLSNVGDNQKTIALKDLLTADTLEIEYSVNSCYHLERYSLRFANGKVEISQLHRPLIPRAPLISECLGTLPLAKAEIEGLDIMLNYFRRPNQLLSTSSLTLDLKQTRDGQIIRQESIHHVEDEKPEPAGVITLRVLIELARALKSSPST